MSVLGISKGAYEPCKDSLARSVRGVVIAGIQFRQYKWPGTGYCLELIEAADAAYRHVRCRDVAEAQALAVESTARREREWQAVQEIGLAVYGRAWLQADERSRICTMWYTCGQDEATAIAELASQGEQR